MIITPDPRSLCHTIIKINVVVFLLWNLGIESLLFFMMRNFLVSWNGLLEGRIWVLVTSVFSHNMLFHLLINMYVFYGFGRVLEVELGRKKFILFFILAGIAGSLGHVLASTLLLHQPSLPALGASGAVSGILLLFSLIFPREKILLLGLIPLPAIWGSVLFVGLDLWGLIAQSRGNGLPIGYGAHLGGALFGLAYFMMAHRRRYNE